MKTIISILVILLSFNVSQAQDQLTGQVLDDNGNPIFFATVALHAAKDSVIIKGESTDEEGLFTFKNLEKGKYFMRAYMLGFKDKTIEGIILPAASKDFITFNMITDANMLSVVEIKERVPLLEQRADKLIVNVENNMTNTSGSLLDVMKKVPGMIVINDRLTMPGTGTPTILINGKTTQYMDVQSLLRDMPGDNIKKIEIIHQPGAEYEAAGSGPILNIILKKNSLYGTNGSVNLGVGRGEIWDYNTGINLSHYAGSFNISGGIGHAQNSYVERLDILRRLTNIDPQLDGIYTQSNENISTPITNRANVRIDYDVTDKHRIGLESKLYDNTNKYIATNSTDVQLSDENLTDYQLSTDNGIDRSWQYLSVNPYYIFEIDTSGQKLEYDLNFARYKVGSENTLITTSSIPINIPQQRYFQPGDTKIFATSLDYTKPLNKTFEVKTGLKYSFADLDNNLRSELLDEKGIWINNQQQSNHYLFSEKIYAAYGKLLFVSGDWNGTAGLRYEQSISTGESLTLDSTQTRTIKKVFPSFSLSRKLTKELTSTVSYSYRINRPRYSSLNPFIYYLDPFTFEQGNPNIRPELTHSAKFTLSYEGQPFFNIEYKKSEDAIVEVTRQEKNTQEASKTDVNFDDRTNFSTSLFFPLDFIPGISGYGGTIVSNNQYNSLYDEAIFERSKWNVTAFLQVEFTLPGEINGEIGGWFTSGSQEGIFVAEHLYGTSVGFSKKFMDNKLKVSIGAEDFFNRFWHAKVDYQQDMELLSSWQAPMVNARISYKFGNQHLKSKKGRSGSASEEIRRAQQGN